MEDQKLPLDKPTQEVKEPTKEVAKTNQKSDLPAKQSPALPKKLIEAGFAKVLMMPKQAFLASGGTEQQFSKEVNFAVQALMGNDFLCGCAIAYPDQFIEAIKNVALTGLTLNPELRLAYLVPYKGKVKFQSSYMGKTDILMRAGVVRWIEANLVYEKDSFETLKGTESQIIHKPNYFLTDRGKLMGGYWVATLPNGVKAFDVMPESRIMDIRKRSEAVKAGKGSPWDTDFEEMAKKTIINWGFKSLPKSGISEDMVKVLEIDGQIDNEDFEEWKKQQQTPKNDKFDEDITYAEEVK